MTFRIISIIIIFLSVYLLFRNFSKNNLSIGKAIEFYWTEFKNSFSIFKNIASQSNSDKLILLKRFFYLSTIFLFILMFFSAYIPIIILGNSLTGLFLLIHVAVAPLFALFLALLILLSAHSNRFNHYDFIKSIEEVKNKIIPSFSFTGYIKISFWLITFFAIPTMVSIILGMFPLFGTEGQIYLLNLHKYSSLVLIVLVIIHTGIIFISSSKDF